MEKNQPGNKDTDEYCSEELYCMILGDFVLRDSNWDNIQRHSNLRHLMEFKHILKSEDWYPSITDKITIIRRIVESEIDQLKKEIEENLNI